MKTVKIITILIIALSAIIFFQYWQNNSIVTTYIEYSNAKVPDGFKGYRIVQISDLHNKEFGKDNAKLLAKIQDAQPDIIVITGDLIDSRKTRTDIALGFVEEAVKISPVYFVSGNHEKSSEYPQFRSQLEQAGVTVLDDSSIELERGQDRVALLGLADPAFIEYPYDYIADNHNFIFAETLASITQGFDTQLTILLSHRPEKMSLYAFQQIDLVFAGHAHGGQFRIPLIGGLIAPEQGFFPKYTSGIYTQDSTSMIVSRGLGNSIIPIRVFNRPELVVVTLVGE